MTRRIPVRPAALWTLQCLLAALFLFAGISKLLMPAATLAQLASMPAAFLKFIGVCETLGALGLVLPGLLRVRLELTPLAAAGLSIVMIGATGATMATHGAAQAAFPFAIGVLTSVVAAGRRAQRPEPRLHAHGLA